MKIKKFSIILKEELENSGLFGMMWDDGNTNAVNTYSGEFKKTKTYFISTKDPLSLEMKYFDDFVELKRILRRYKIEFEYKTIEDKELEKIDEGWRTWVTGALASLSLLTSTPSFSANANTTDGGGSWGGNRVQVPSESNVYKGTSDGTSVDISMAEKLAMSNAKRDVIRKIGGDNSVSTASLSVVESKIISQKKNSDGTVTVTIEYRIKVNDSKTKQISKSSTRTLSGDKVKDIMSKIIDRYHSKNPGVKYTMMHNRGEFNGGAVESIIEMFINRQVRKGVEKFNVTMTDTDEAGQVRGDAIIFSVSTDGRDWVVITPQL